MCWEFQLFVACGFGMAVTEHGNAWLLSLLSLLVTTCMNMDNDRDREPFHMPKLHEEYFDYTMHMLI